MAAVLARHLYQPVTEAFTKGFRLGVGDMMQITWDIQQGKRHLFSKKQALYGSFIAKITDNSFKKQARIFQPNRYAPPHPMMMPSNAPIST